MAAVAMTAVITDPARVLPKEEVEIACNADDLEILFIDFLNTVICEMDLRKMFFSKFKVKIDGNSLKAKCYGEKIDIKKHEPAVEVKAATLCELKVQQHSDSVWVAQCVLDV
jgi:SHS2 domain-containing protein